MITVGHTLLGAAVAVVCLPKPCPWPRALGHSAAFMLAANVPDLPLPGWGHDRYDISHSVFSNALLIVAVTAALGLPKPARRWVGGWGVLAALAGAWLSHLLLDSFYNHGRGVAIFWPVSSARLALPIPWFSVVPPPPPFTAALWKEFAAEVVSYGPLLAAALVWRRRRRATGQTPR